MRCGAVRGLAGGDRLMATINRALPLEQNPNRVAPTGPSVVTTSADDSGSKVHHSARARHPSLSLPLSLSLSAVYKVAWALQH